MSDKRIRIPAAAELIDAVAGFLEQELLPTLEGSKQFNTRVSVNALRIVLRELTQPVDETVVTGVKDLLGSGHSERSGESQDDLAGLLLKLAAHIRSGNLDESNPALLAVLRQHSLQQLAVDNPRYSSYLAARDRK